jgi:hypothetical protein
VKAQIILGGKTNMKKSFIKATILALMLVTTVSQGSKVLAAYPTEYYSVPLSYPASAYSSIGSYVKAVAYATPDYNCLGYAVGFPAFLWPWKNATTGGGRLADLPEVTKYLKDSFSYTTCTAPYQPQVMAYGENYLKIGHFAKGIGTDSKAKWGSLEVMYSTGWDPYNYCPAGYGKLQAKFKK